MTQGRPTVAAPEIGVAGWCLAGDPFGQMTQARDLGFRHIQLDCGGPGRGLDLALPGVAEAVREAAAEMGVSIVGLAGNRLNDVGLVHPADGAEGRAARRAMASVIDAADRLGVGFVFFPSFRRGAIVDRAGLDNTAHALAAAAAEAGDLIIGTENGLDADGASRLLERAGVSTLRLVFDPLNLWRCGGDPMALIDRLHPWLAPRIHAKNGTQGLTGDTDLTRGDQPVDRALKRLALADLAEPSAAAGRLVVIETAYRLMPPDAVPKAVAADRACIADAWRRAAVAFERRGPAAS